MRTGGGVIVSVTSPEHTKLDVVPQHALLGEMKDRSAPRGPQTTREGEPERNSGHGAEHGAGWFGRPDVVAHTGWVTSQAWKSCASLLPTETDSAPPADFAAAATMSRSA